MVPVCELLVGVTAALLSLPPSKGVFGDSNTKEGLHPTSRKKCDNNVGGVYTPPSTIDVSDATLDGDDDENHIVPA